MFVIPGLDNHPQSALCQSSMSGIVLGMRDTAIEKTETNTVPSLKECGAHRECGC